MIDHEHALELAATAFDFELSPTDDEALTAHLASCESCRATAQAHARRCGRAGRP